MLSPWILAILAILLLALFIWLLLRERSARLAADTKVKPIAFKETAGPAAPARPAAPVPMTGPAPADLKEPAVVLLEPAAPAPVEAIPVAPDKLAADIAPEAEQAVEIKSEEAAAPIESTPPSGAAKPDDLEVIEGIGPKIAGILRDAGVRTFAQLAALDPARITEILHAGGIHLAEPRSWPEQARLAADGDQAGLQALQDRLKGGREVA